jgi:hypothetical protein
MPRKRAALRFLRRTIYIPQGRNIVSVNPAVLMDDIEKDTFKPLLVKLCSTAWLNEVMLKECHDVNVN